MFKALLARTIYDGPSEQRSKKIATLSKEIHLPFQPSLDIEISTAGVGPTKLSRIKWQHESANFICDYEEEFSRVRDGQITDLDRLLSLAVADGWKIVSVDPLD